MTWDLLVLGASDGRAVAVSGDRVAWSGPEGDLPTRDAATVVDAEGALVTPGLIDCHTHLVFAGDRAAEYEQRLAGVTYEQISAAGGGIRSTVRATRKASADELLEAAAARATALAAGGVTTIEVKSGYGLDTETEMRMLDVARRIPERVPVDVVTTFLGAHTVPPELEGRADEYLDLVCDEMIPAVAATARAAAVDCFCERIAFTAAQTERVFTVARSSGLAVKLHADQLSDSGGAALAARHDALSADHLEHSSPDGVAAMAAAGTVAVLLPGATLLAGDGALPPVAALRAAGVPIAVATDCNPGTSPLLSPVLAMQLACALFGLTPVEALAGMTIHAAQALGLVGEVGTLTAGARADLVVWDVARPVDLVYWLGARPARTVVHRGKVVSP